MLPLNYWPLQDRQRITGVFTDIDDTLTTEGAITPDALAALYDLKAAGIRVIAITGRPAGWSEPFAKTWPVDAIVAENGAVALQKMHQNSPEPSDYGHTPLLKRYQQDVPTRAANKLRMQQVLARVIRDVSGAVPARDSAGRETDIAIDHSEFTHLTTEQIGQTVHIMQSEGMNATVSSIHINGWFGSHNKLEGARWILRELFGSALATEMDNWAFVGDSTNDQLMFEAFGNSVGVANIARFLPTLKTKPRYVTQGARGAGFAEVASLICLGRLI